MAKRHLRPQAEAITKQKQIIETLRALRYSTDLAEDLLDTMEWTLERTRSELRRYRE